MVSTSLNNMKVSWDYSSQLNGQIKSMFQTTNEIIHNPCVPFIFSIDSENLHFSRGSNSSRPCEAHSARPHGHLPIRPTSRSPSLTTPARAKSHFTEASKKPWWSHGTHGGGHGIISVASINIFLYGIKNP